ncbi:terpenoid synthase [Marasmius fiardii PR-910]|nr:terpenoid synthase [Marasmius fiardii PR-910]
MVRITSLKSIDTRQYQKFFSSFGVDDCWDEMGQVVNTCLYQTIEQCTKPETREHKKAMYRHQNPAGNLFSLCFGLSDAERFSFIVRFIEFLCIIDDVLEDLPHGEALVEHDILCDALRGSVDTTKFTKNTRPEWIKFLQDIKAEMLAVDPVRSPALLLTFEESLRARDSSDVEFDTIEQYIPYRLINFDYEFVAQLILWAMAVDVFPKEGDLDALKSFKHSIGVIVGLVNDYFSWEREKRQQQDSDRIRNGVAVLMKQHKLSDRDAKDAVKKLIDAEEQKVHTVLDDSCLEFSVDKRQYLDGLKMFAAGYSFWCATCPRYSRPQGDE